MNEEALKDAFNLFVQTGYDGDINKFVNLISTNPEALKDAHQLFVQTGYDGDINRFKNLLGIGQQQHAALKKKEGFGGVLSQPFEAVQDIQELAQQESVSPSDQSSSVSQSPSFYSQLPKAGMQQGPPMRPADQVQPDYTKMADIEQATLGVVKPPQEVEVPFKMENKPKDILKEQMFEEMRKERKEDTEGIPKFAAEAYKQITGDFLKRSSNAVKNDLEYYLGDAGFTVDDSGYLTLVAPNGKRAPLKGADLKTVANEIKDFIKENITSVGADEMTRLQKEYNEGRKKFLNEQQIKEEFNILNESAESLKDEINNTFKEETDLFKLQDQIQSYPQNQRNTAAYQTLVNDYNSRLNNFNTNKSKIEERIKQTELRDSNLKRAAGEYLKNKEETGTFVGTLQRAFTDGIGSITAQSTEFFINRYWNNIGLEFALGKDLYEEEMKAAALDADIDINKVLLPNEYFSKLSDPQKRFAVLEAKRLREELEPEVRDKFKKISKYGEFRGIELNTTTINDLREYFTEKFGPSSTTKEYKEKLEQEGNLLQRGLVGLAGSAPAMIGPPILRVLNMFSLTTDAVKKEMEDNPEFENISENEKEMVAIPIGIVGAALEEFGLRNLIKGKSILAGITNRVLKKLPAGATASQIRSAAISEIKEMGLKGGLTLLGAGLAEAETGGAQQVAEFAIKDIYNTMKGKEMFETPIFMSQDYINKIADAAATEAIGGFVMGVPNSISAAFEKDGFQGLSDDMFLMFEELSKSSDSKKLFAINLKNKINEGKITKAQAEKILDNYNNSVGISNQILDDITDVGDRKKAMDLLVERKKLQDKKQGKDEALAKPIQDRIDAINNELTKISQQAVERQEQSTDIPSEISSLNDDEIVTFRVASLEDVPEEFRDKAREIGGGEIETRQLIFGLPFGKRETVTVPKAYVYSLTGKEAKDYAVQKQAASQVSVQPEARVGEEMVQGEPKAGPQVTTQEGVIEEKVTPKQATVDIFTSTPIETKAQITFTSPDGNDVSLDGNEEVAAQLYDEAIAVPKEQRTKEQNEIVEKFKPIVAENEANLLESLLAEENVPEAAPTEAAPAEARVEFTEQDRARKTELEDAMKNSDKRRKNIMVGDTSVPKAEVKAELDALNKKEQDSTKQETGQFQLEISENRSKAQQELIDEATSLMEKEEENGFSEKVFDGTQPEPTVEIIPIEIKENTELAKKVKRMGLSQLIGKKINLVMADQLKVGNLSIGGKILNRMGGPFFPLIDKLFGKIAWASMDLNAASTIVNGAIKSDYTVVYNMNPSAIDSNNAIRETFIETIESLPIQEQDVLFKQIVDHLKDKKFGDKTTQVRDIVSKSETLKGFFDDVSKLDVDTKAAIINLIVPSRNLVSETAIGKSLQEKDITIENLREQNIEQFVADLPAGALTMVLEIQDKSGNKVTEKTKAEAILNREQQEKEGLPTHDNYPIYLRGKAIAILSETVPFWNIFKDSLENINAKVAKILTKKTGKEYTAKEARSNEMRSASMTANVAREVSSPSVTEYEKFISLLSRAFPSIEIVTSQKEFDKLANDLNAQKLSTKDQNIYGAVYKGKLYLNPSLENYNTPIHEFGHIWTNIVKDSNPKLYNKGIELISKSPYVQQILNSKEYQRVIKEMRNNGISEAEINEYVLEEALATAIGDKGESFVIASQAKNFEKWLDRLYSFVRKLTGISKYTEQQLQDITLNEFLQAVSVDILSGNVLFEQSKIKEFSDKLQLSTGGFDFNKAIDIAKKNGISDEGIRIFLKRKGLDEAKINQLLGTEPTTRATKMNESTFPGYDAIMDKVDAMIARQIKRGIEVSKIAKNLDNLLRKFDEYVNATDAQKKALEQEARNRIGSEQKKAPSFGRILGAFKDLTTLNTKDKKKIVSNLMQLAKDAAKDLAAEIKAMKVNGKITSSQLTAIQNRLSKVNFTNEVSINAFVDYMAKVFNDVEYANKMTEVRKLQAQVKRKKHMSMSQAVKEFLSINPELIPDNMLLPYIQALDSLNTRTPSYLLMNKIYNDIISLKQDGKEFDEIKTIEAMAKKWESISLNAVKSVEEYVALIRDINSYKRKAYQLFENGTITQQQYETLMDAVGKDQDAVEKKYAKELKKIKDELIGEIDGLRPKENENLSAEENELISKYLETKKEDLETLSPEQLYVLRDLLENLKNGEFDYYRLSDIVSKLYTNKDSETFNKELEQSNFDLREDQGLQRLAEYESSFWEGLLGLGRATSGALQKYIVTPFNRALASYEDFVQKSANVFIKLKNKYNINDYGMHKLGMLTTYLQEYMAQFDPENANEPNIGTRDWFKEIINNDSMRKKYKSKTGILRYVGMNRTEDELIEKIWDSLPKDSNGNVDPKAVYDSYMANDGKYFTKNEKAFFDAVLEWKENNVTGKQKAANELRGNPFKSIAFHMPRVRLLDGKKQIDAKSTSENNLVRLEAGTGKERASQAVGPIMTNFEQLFYNNIEQTARDYYITKALKDINNILSSAKRSLGQDKVTLLNVISGTLSDALNFEFESTKSNPIARGIMAAKVAEQLLDPIKTIRELIASFVSFPFKGGNISAYRELFGKVRDMKDLLEFTDSPLRLRNNISSAIDISDAKFTKMKFMEKTLIYLTGLPERTMMVTSWMPTFRQEFESIAGVKFNEKSFKESKAYREQYGKAIKEAAAAADAQTEKIIGTTTKAGQRRQVRIAPKLLANLVGREGTVDRNSVEGQILGFFSNYSFREITEFINGFREFAEVYKNYKSQKAGNAKALKEATKRLSKPLGIVLNIATYGYLTAVLYALELILLGDDEEEEKGFTMLERLTTVKGFNEELTGNLIATAASKYSGGGRIGMQLMGTLGMMLTDDPAQKESIKNILKESVYVKPLPVEKATQYGGKDSVMASLANYIPHFALVADRIIETIESGQNISYIWDKVEKNGVESLSKDEGAKVLALNTMLNTLQAFANAFGTSVPAYNKFKRIIRARKKEAGVDDIGTAPSEKKKAYGGYDTIDDFKLGNPKKYEEYSKEGGLLYEYRKKTNEANAQSKFAKFKALEDRYGEDAIKDLKGYEKYKEYKESGSSNISTDRNTPSPDRNTPSPDRNTASPERY